MRLKFYNPKTLKSLWLFGRNFKALIKIVPTTYDPSNIILKVELFKLYREVRPIYERPDSINPIESNRTIFDDQIIDGVYTFTVLPHGQLMVFFASQFCYISPYDFEVFLLSIDLSNHLSIYLYIYNINFSIQSISFLSSFFHSFLGGKKNLSTYYSNWIVFYICYNEFCFSAICETWARCSVVPLQPMRYWRSECTLFRTFRTAIAIRHRHIPWSIMKVPI